MGSNFGLTRYGGGWDGREVDKPSIQMHSVSTVQCKLVCFSGGHFVDPVVSQLREWRL